MKLTTTDGVKLFVERSGAGSPCLYLHGGPGYWSKSFHSVVGERLEEQLDMIYLDQRGCGRSGYADDYSLNRLVTDIEEVRKQLGIETWHIMGHSFGAVLAVHYATCFPQRVNGVILSNATLNLSDSLCHQIQKGRELLGKHPLHVEDHNHAAIMDLFYTVQTELLEQGLYFQLQYRNIEHKQKQDEIDKELRADPVFQQYVFSATEYFQDFSSKTKEITSPVLVIAGEHDHAIGPRHHLSFCFPNAIISVLDCAHHPYVECPDEFTQDIFNFVNRSD